MRRNMVLYSFMKKIAPEPHDWSEKPNNNLGKYLERYGSMERVR